MLGACCRASTSASIRRGGSVRIHRLAVGALETNCWIVTDDSGGPAVVIDPGDDFARIEEALSGGRVSAIVLTHGHFDHIGAVSALVAATGAPLYVHEADADRITTATGSGGAMFGFHDHVSPPADRLLADGDTLAAGELSLRVLHTPGHTPGCICVLVTEEGGVGHLFAGDTLFSGSVGRTDFPGGDARVLAGSIATRLAPLPADTIVHPGHGPDTTIGREARINPFWPRG